MNYSVLAETAGRFKFKEEGVREMCVIFEEIRRESYDAGLKTGYDAAEKKATATTRKETIKEIAMNFIKEGDLPLEKIAKSTGLSLAKLEELKAECDKQKA